MGTGVNGELLSFVFLFPVVGGRGCLTGGRQIWLHYIININNILGYSISANTT